MTHYNLGQERGVIGIMLHGPSLHFLDDNIELFRGLNISWVSLNRFWVAESILEKIGEKLSVVFSLASEQHDRKIVKPMLRAREEEGLIYIEKAQVNSMPPEYLTGSKDQGTFYMMLMYLKYLGLDDIYIFGGDGIVRDPNSPYFKHGLIPGIHKHHVEELARDTENFNKTVKDLDPFKGMKITNCYQDSAYEGFPKVTVEKALTLIMEDLKC